jgi:mRNA-degrading endonuclease RelE of RelBE toxin-antitoxin system
LLIPKASSNQHISSTSPATLVLWRATGPQFLIRLPQCGEIQTAFDESRTTMFDIKFTEHAVEDLQVFTRSEQKWIVEMLEKQLIQDAASESEDRKRLNSDGQAQWEIRLGKARVFYDVDIDKKTVKVKAVGKKFFL